MQKVCNLFNISSIIYYFAVNSNYVDYIHLIFCTTCYQGYTSVPSSSSSLSSSTSDIPLSISEAFLKTKSHVPKWVGGGGGREGDSLQKLSSKRGAYERVKA